MILVLLGIFARAYGSVSDDYFHTADIAADNGFILGGGTWSWGSGQYDIFVVKTDPYGVGVWAAVYGGAGADEAEAIVTTADEGYAIAGLTSSYGSGSADMLVLKLTSAGVISWARVLGGTGIDEAYGIAQVTDGGYVATGRTWVSGEGYNLLVFKLNTDGTWSWGRSFGGTVDDYGYWVAPTADGGAVVTGGTRSYGAGQDDAAVLVFTSGGLRKWFRVMGGSGVDFGQCVIQTSDSGFLMVGRTNSWGAGGYDFLVLRLDSQGALTWARAIGGTADDFAYSVVQTTDGGFVVAGETWSFGQGMNEALIIKLDAGGTLQWARIFGGSENDYARAVMETSDAGLAIAGATSSFGLASGLYTFLMRMDSDGEYPGCVESCSPIVSNISPSSLAPTIYVASTPTNSSPSVSFSSVEPNQADLCEPVGGDEGQGAWNPVTCRSVPGGVVFTVSAQANLSVYAVDGRLIYSGELKQGQNRIGLNRGVYVWLIRNQKGKAVVR